MRPLKRRKALKVKPLKDVRPLYKAFRQHLFKRCEKFARLQILCRLEDYLTKEFGVFIMEQSGTLVLPILNSGRKADGRRIDMALAVGNLSEASDKHSLKKLLTIRCFIELKYICNRQGFRYGNAEDLIGPTLKSLYEQLGHFKMNEYATYPVRLRSGKRDIYGIVFASYVY
jgi:hypothetical protein